MYNDDAERLWLRAGFKLAESSDAVSVAGGCGMEVGWLRSPHPSSVAPHPKVGVADDG